MIQTMIEQAGRWFVPHNFLLTGLALLVAGAGAYLIAVLAARGLAASPGRRWIWLLLLAPNFAATIWATHFIVLLATLPGLFFFQAFYHTALFLLAAMAVAVPPLGLMLLYPRGRFTPLLAGAGMGLTIGGMRFSGMSAMGFCGAAGCATHAGPLAMALGGWFAILAVRMLTRPGGKPHLARATLALAAAICSVQFIASHGAAPLSGGNPQAVAILVSFVSGVLLFAAFLAAGMDRKLALMSQVQAEALNYFATHDELTRLANRRPLYEGVARLQRQPGQRFALLYIDIDRFKSINSLFGHATGDKLLLQATRRLRALLAPGDMLARLGGDEFALLRPVPESGQEITLAEHIVQAMAAPFRLAEGPMRIGASVGLVVWPGAVAESPEALLGQEDMALAQAKQRGGGQICLYTPEMSTHIALRRQLERDLGAAIARGEMFLHFQPLCAANGMPRGFEALLRWKHHERGMISPVEFIPFAERSGHIHAIGMFVLEQACRAATAWPDDLRVAVNISAVQLGGEGLFDTIKEILSRTGLPPNRLELEITESTLIEDAGRVSKLLRDMHDYGLQLAIDDFGTGYSNLSHLRDFRAGRLKIDRSFISGLRGDSGAASIIRAIAGLGHALNMQVLAEGVETESELRLVRAMLCDEVQGYYLARPMPEAEILPWLAQARRPLPHALALTEYGHSV